MPRAIGEGTRSLLIPNVPSLAGIDFFAQAVVFGPGFAPRLTNRLRERVD